MMVVEPFSIVGFSYPESETLSWVIVNTTDLRLIRREENKRICSNRVSGPARDAVGIAFDSMIGEVLYRRASLWILSDRQNRNSRSDFALGA
jgi:hypothetical protein